MPERRDQNLGDERLLLDPDPGVEDRGEQVVARSRRVVGGDESGEPVALGRIERRAASPKPPQGARVHPDRLDPSAHAPGEAAYLCTGGGFPVEIV